MHLNLSTLSERLGRLSAAMLLAMFTSLLIGPAVTAATRDVGAALPACCRMHGAHHCSTEVKAAHSSGQATLDRVHAPCPCPSTAAPAHGNTSVGGGTCKYTFASEAACRAVRPGNHMAERATLDKSNRKRGPPAAAPAA